LEVVRNFVKRRGKVQSLLELGSGTEEGGGRKSGEKSARKRGGGQKEIAGWEAAALLRLRIEDWGYNLCVEGDALLE